METAPLHALQDVPEGGRAFYTNASDGVRVRAALWTGGNAGTALLFPGRTEYIEKYGRMVAKLQARGLNVVVIDWRGQGLSDRTDNRTDRGHVENFLDYQLDIEAIMAIPDIAALSGPRYLFAHSMGACIALRSIIDGIDLDGVVMSAPMWGLPGPPGSRHALNLVNTIGRIFGAHKSHVPGTKPTYYVEAAPFEGNELTNDADYYAMFRAQLKGHGELGLGGPTIHWAAEALKEMSALKAANVPDIPMLVFLGTAEAVVDANAVKSRVPTLPKARLEMLENGKHECWMETPVLQERIWSLTDNFLGVSVKG